MGDNGHIFETVTQSANGGGPPFTLDWCGDCGTLRRRYADGRAAVYPDEYRMGGGGWLATAPRCPGSTVLAVNGAFAGVVRAAGTNGGKMGRIDVAGFTLDGLMERSPDVAGSLAVHAMTWVPPAGATVIASHFTVAISDGLDWRYYDRQGRWNLTEVTR